MCIFFRRLYCWHGLIFLRTERKEDLAASMAAKQKTRADNIATMRNERRNYKWKGVGKAKNKARPMK